MNRLLIGIFTIVSAGTMLLCFPARGQAYESSKGEPMFMSSSGKKQLKQSQAYLDKGNASLTEAQDLETQLREARSSKDPNDATLQKELGKLQLKTTNKYIEASDHFGRAHEISYNAYSTYIKKFHTTNPGAKKDLQEAGKIEPVAFQLFEDGRSNRQLARKEKPEGKLILLQTADSLQLEAVNRFEVLHDVYSTYPIRYNYGKIQQKFPELEEFLAMQKSSLEEPSSLYEVVKIDETQIDLFNRFLTQEYPDDYEYYVINFRNLDYSNVQSIREAWTKYVYGSEDASRVTPGLSRTTAAQTTTMPGESRTESQKSVVPAPGTGQSTTAVSRVPAPVASSSQLTQTAQSRPSTQTSTPASTQVPAPATTSTPTSTPTQTASLPLPKTQTQSLTQTQTQAQAQTHTQAQAQPKVTPTDQGSSALPAPQTVTTGQPVSPVTDGSAQPRPQTQQPVPTTTTTQSTSRPVTPVTIASSKPDPVDRPAITPEGQVVTSGIETTTTTSKASPETSVTGFSFRVQIAASRAPLNQAQLGTLFKGERTPDQFHEENWYRYTIGPFTTYNEAVRFRDQTSVQDAFVVTYLNGKRATSGQGRTGTSAGQTTQVKPVDQRGFAYRVQVAAAREPLSAGFIRALYQGNKLVEVHRVNGWYKYSILSHGTYTEARKEANQCGVPGAFVVPFLNNQPIDMKTAKQYENQ